MAGLFRRDRMSSRKTPPGARARRGVSHRTLAAQRPSFPKRHRSVAPRVTAEGSCLHAQTKGDGEAEPGVKPKGPNPAPTDMTEQAQTGRATSGDFDEARLLDTQRAFDSVAPDYDGPRGNNE